MTEKNFTTVADFTAVLSGSAAEACAQFKDIAGLTCKQSENDQGLDLALLANAQLSSILHLVHDGKRATPQKIKLTLAPNSRMTLIESFVSSNDAAQEPHACEIVLQDGAHLNYTRIQNEGSNATHTGKTSVTQERDSQFDAIILALGSKTARHNLDFALMGDGTQTRFFGLYVGNGDQRLEQHTFVDHQNPNSASEQIYKGILGGNAKGVFEGRIDVRKEAQKTDARQTNKTLLLSKGARIDTIPQLNIHADDVKCSHGAAVGQLNAEELFYFESRAIARAVAQRMLVEGFAEDILTRQSNARVLNYVHTVLAAKLATLAVEL
jgi:Fe-S cluster assembly protein SufD